MSYIRCWYQYYHYHYSDGDDDDGEWWLMPVHLHSLWASRARKGMRKGVPKDGGLFGLGLTRRVVVYRKIKGSPISKEGLWWASNPPSHISSAGEKARGDAFCPSSVAVVSTHNRKRKSGESYPHHPAACALVVCTMCPRGMVNENRCWGPHCECTRLIRTRN